MGQINQKPTRSSVRSFAGTAHLFACSALLVSLARSAALTHLLAHGTVSDLMAILSVFFFIVDHSAMVPPAEALEEMNVFEGNESESRGSATS